MSRTLCLPFIKIITHANDVLNMFKTNKSDWDHVHVELPLLIVNDYVQTVNLYCTYSSSN